jgi:uncharacterized protein with NRDE domain
MALKMVWLFHEVNQKRNHTGNTFFTSNATSSTSWYKCKRLRRELIHLIIEHSINNIKHPFFQIALTYKKIYFWTKSKPALAYIADQWEWHCKNTLIRAMKKSDGLERLQNVMLLIEKIVLIFILLTFPSGNETPLSLRLQTVMLDYFFYLSSPIKD